MFDHCTCMSSTQYLQHYIKPLLQLILSLSWLKQCYTTIEVSILLIHVTTIIKQRMYIQISDCELKASKELLPVLIFTWGAKPPPRDITGAAVALLVVPMGRGLHSLQWWLQAMSHHPVRINGTNISQEFCVWFSYFGCKLATLSQLCCIMHGHMLYVSHSTAPVCIM